jgi:hypothetical protein
MSSLSQPGPGLSPAERHDEHPGSGGTGGSAQIVPMHAFAQASVLHAHVRRSVNSVVELPLQTSSIVPAIICEKAAAHRRQPPPPAPLVLLVPVLVVPPPAPPAPVLDVVGLHAPVAVVTAPVVPLAPPLPPPQLEATPIAKNGTAAQTSLIRAWFALALGSSSGLWGGLAVSRRPVILDGARRWR